MSRPHSRAGAALGPAIRAGALALLLAGFPLVASAETLVLQLPGEPQFEFAGYYAALWQGFYRDAGLDVEIKPPEVKGGPAKLGTPGAGPLDPVREVAEGRAQFATGSMSLVVRAGQGQPLLLLAPVFQRSGAAVYYRADHPFSSPGALLKAKLGRPPPSNILDGELMTALHAEGIDPDKVHSSVVEPSRAVAAIADNTVDAVVGSPWDLPWQARQRGLALKSFELGDYRVEFYGDTLFTSRHFASAAPDTVRRFREASIRGWEYAFQHAADIASRIAAEPNAATAGGDASGFARYQSEVARSLARYPDVPVGQSNPDRWRRIEDSLVASGAMRHAIEPAAFIYTAEPGNQPWRDPRISYGLAGLAGIVVGALGLAAFRHGRRVRPPRPLPALDLNPALSALERRIRRQLRGKTEFRLSLSPDLWPCHADASAVARLVLDLAVAAAADLRKAGHLIVGTRNHPIDDARAGEIEGARAGDYVRVTVRDDGPGLADPALAQVLDPKRSAKPAIAKAARRVRPLGGLCRVESAEGVGTAVHLYFPRALDGRPDAEPDAAEPSSLKAAE